MTYFVIGEAEIVLGFSLAGIKGKEAVGRTQVLDAFSRVTGGIPIAQDEMPVVLILTETAAATIQEELTRHQMSGRYPLVVEIPGINGHLEGKKTLTDSIRTAIGMKV